MDTFSFEPGSAADRAARADYWRVYSASHDYILDRLMRVIAAHPTLGPLVASTPRADLGAQHAASLARVRSALLDDDWEPYAASLRQQGATYARMGVPFDAWQELARIHQGILIPLLVREFASEPERLSRVLIAKQHFIESGLTALAKAYFDAKESALAMQRSIAESRAAELEKSAAILRAVLDSIPHGVLVIDDAGEYVIVNRAAQEITRLHAGRNAATIGFETFDASTNAPVPVDELPTRRAQRGEAFEGVELRIQYPHRDGPRILSCRGGPLSGTREIRGGVVCFEDVTEHKLFEAAQDRSRMLEEENRRIQGANRMKSEFLANMSHELRTPLNAIIGFTELLFDGVVDSSSPNYRTFLSDILESSRHLLELINDVLDLSKVEAGKMEFRPQLVDLSAIVSDVLAVLRGQSAEKQITTAVEVDPTVTTAVVDPGRFKQVLYNYISNAIKFTPSRGRITVRVRAEADPGMFRLEVIDTGIGIASANLSRLFVEFEQLESGASKTHGGTGLGLALTRRLVEAQGGFTGATSTLGVGSTFFAVMPRDGVPVDGRAERAVHEAARIGASRILVIEDDAGAQGVLVGTLTAAGYAVEAVRTGEQALESLRRQRFDAVTLDLLLPDMSGLDVLRAIRRSHSRAQLPVIVVSVAASAANAAGLAVDDFLAKPVDSDALLDSLARAGVSPERGAVLVVDDDPSALRLMQATLAQLGYRSVCESDAAVALERCATEVPAAVIVDLLMPRVDGFEFVERFRANPEHRRIPVIVWSVKDLSIEERGRLSSRADAILRKGGGRGNLLDAIGALLSPRGSAAS